MSGLQEIAPVFPVRDLEAAMSHYRSLGFTVDSHDPGYGFAEREGVHLHLAVVHDHDPSRSNSAAYLYVDDADALFEAWRAAGVGGRLMATEDTPYGLREGAHIDLDGNLLRFGSWMASHPRPGE